MIALVIAGSAIAAAVVLAGGLVIGWGIHGLATANRCPCSHPYSFVDKFTGNCTGTMTEVHWTSGCRADRKTVPCKCKAHWRPGISIAEPLDREFAEGASTS